MRPLELLHATCRKAVKPMVLLLAKTNVTPNQITVFNFLFFIPLSVFFFSKGDYISSLIGLVLLCLYGFVDFIDGMLARLKSMASRAGAWLDSTLDTITCSFVLISLTVGFLNANAHLSIFGLYSYQVSYAIVLVVGFLALFAQLICTLLMNGLENTSRLWSNATKIDEQFRSKGSVPAHQKVIKSILLPFSWSWVIFGYTVLVGVGVLLNLTFLALVIIAVAHNIRGILLGYTLFRVHQGRDDPMIIRIANNVVGSK